MESQWIMVAGPYRSGAATPDAQARNLRAMNEAAYLVLLKGHIPIVGVNLAQPIIDVAGPATYDAVMMPISLAAADRCDAVREVHEMCFAALVFPPPEDLRSDAYGFDGVRRAFCPNAGQRVLYGIGRGDAGRL